MVTNLFAGFLSSDFMCVACGTGNALCAVKDTQDPARDWKLNQILITHLTKRIFK